MEISLTIAQTILVAILVYFIGYGLNAKVGFLREYNIPVPVVGGLVFAVLITLVRGQFDTSFKFDMVLRTPMMLIFFTTIGLSADVRMLAKGGPKLVIFLAIAALFVALQDAVGVSMALAMDMHPLVGLVGGSVTLTGGHGTGAAYAEQFSDVNNIQGVMELAMATATFGLVIGGLLGGPVGHALIAKTGSSPSREEPKGAAEIIKEAAEQITTVSFMATSALILVCAMGGLAISAAVAGTKLALPVFVWCLFLGIIVANALSLTGLFRIDQACLDLIGSIALALFLVMSLMSLRLWELVGLAGPMLAIVLVQTILMATYAYFVTFRLMGGDYDAAVIAGGHCGFGLGATPTAVANMDALVARHGPSPQAYLIIPIVGAFFIDIINAIVIQGYLALPQLGF